MRTLFDGMVRKILRSPVALLLLVWAAPALAQGVAMVTDLSGKAVLEGAPGKGSLTILSEIAPGARVQLEGGSRLVVVYLNSGDEYAFAGPAQIQFRSNEPQVVSGSPPQKRGSLLAKGAREPTIRVTGVAQAGFVMRSGRTSGRIRLLTLAGTRTLESSPEFRWQETSAVTRYHFRLFDDVGKPLHEAEVEGAAYALPAAVRLNEGVSYTWELSAQFSDGRRYVSTGDFRLASRELRAQVEALRPAAGASVAERVLFAAWLEHAELKDEAKKHWKALLAERPEDPALQALAEEVTHPPRTVSDVTALLDQYRPDPAEVEALKAKLKQEPPAGANREALLRFYLERAQAAQGLGMPRRQIADLRRALEIVKGTEDEWQVMQDVWIAEIQSGNFATALKIKEQMPRLVGRLRGRLVADYGNAAVMYSTTGDVAAARTALGRLEGVLNFDLARSPSWAQFGDNWIALQENARASVLNAEGRHIEAETAHRKALAATERNLAIALRRDAGNPLAPLERSYNFVDVSEQGLANNLILQGRLAEAELAVRNVLQRRLSRLGRYAPPTAGAVVQFARLLNEQGRFREAEALARAAMDIHKTIGSAPAALSYIGARRQLGRALVAQSRWKEALPVFEEMGADLATDPVLLERWGRGDPNWGIALVKTGQPEKALPMLEGGLKRWSARLGPSHHEVAERRGFLAIALAETGQRQRALSEFHEAVKVLLARGRIEADEESGASARAWRLVLILEGYIKLLHDIRNELGQQRTGLDPAAEAFRLADAARGQSTQRALTASAARATVNDPALADLIRREQDAKQQVAVLYSTLLRLLNAPADQQLPQVAAQMRNRIQELEKERRQLFTDLEKRHPAYVNLINPRPATIEETRAALREGEVLLSVLTAEDRTYVWAVPKSGPVAFHAAALGEKAVAGIVAGLRKALDPGRVSLENVPAFDVMAAHRLYAEVLLPVEGAWKGAHTLMVLANGALAQLPFSLLPTAPAPPATDAGVGFERYKAVPWLIRQIAVVQLPAANTLVTLRSLREGNPGRAVFAGFGDPQFGPQLALAEPLEPKVLALRNLAVPRVEGENKPVDWIPYSRLSRLPDTRDEILAIAAALKADPRNDVFLGPSASKQSVKSADLSRRRIVAFATHGLIPGDFPDLDQPALALSAPDGRAETGLLTLEDILALKMDADWVVLSACNTAAGEGAGAEAISGLGRGFFYAGSRALLVTHWPVETSSARLLVTNLFERYAGSPSLSRAEALRQASLTVMEGTGRDGAMSFSYAHPLFWAPYALVGDGGR